ncbi:MAG: TonB-dependent receptor domain-containing protein, partial [Gemmatimonadota bacterium]
SELGAGLVPANLGNPALKPEISTETEFGFEAGILDNRVAIEFTSWQRQVNDLLVAQQFPVSGGFRATQLNNIGSMEANGLEMGFKWFAIQNQNLSADFFFNAAYLKQTLTDLGGAPPLKIGLHPLPRLPEGGVSPRFALLAASRRDLPGGRAADQRRRPGDRLLQPGDAAPDQLQRAELARDARSAPDLPRHPARPEVRGGAERPPAAARRLRRQQEHRRAVRRRRDP